VALSDHSDNEHDFQQYQFIDTTPPKIQKVIDTTPPKIQKVIDTTPPKIHKVALCMDYILPPTPLRFPLLEMYADMASFSCFEIDCTEKNKCYYCDKTRTWVAPHAINECKSICPDQPLVVVGY
jgi:hypothetical protein